MNLYISMRPFLFFSIVVSKGDINKVLALYNLDDKLHAFFHSVNRHVLKA